MVKEIASSFIRWKNNTCIVYDREGDSIAIEDMSKYSYYSDILENKTIKLLSVELSEIKKNAFSRLEKYKSVWEEDRGNFHDVYSNFKQIIWNQKNKFKIDKILEKNPNQENFEFFLNYFKSYLEEFSHQ